jgi:hypothetical protein
MTIGGQDMPVHCVCSDVERLFRPNAEAFGITRVRLGVAIVDALPLAVLDDDPADVRTNGLRERNRHGGRRRRYGSPSSRLSRLRKGMSEGDAESAKGNYCSERQKSN